eukprot:Em0004g1034a
MNRLTWDNCSIADILQNQGTGVAASVGGTAPLSGAGALIVDAISQSSHVDGLATCSVSVLGAEGTTVQDEKSFISKGGIELLKIDSTDIVKYGLALLDALFTDEEQATHCYKASGKSNSSSVSAQPPMSPGRVKTLDAVGGLGSTELVKTSETPVDMFLDTIQPLLHQEHLLCVGLAAGQAARASKQSKHDENDAKCKELGWICVPMVVEAYGAWVTEAMESFSLLASRLATSSNRAKAEVLAALYRMLNLNLPSTVSSTTAKCIPKSSSIQCFSMHDLRL